MGEAWVDSVVNYLDLGTRGVAIAIDRADIVRLGELVRRLVLHDASTRVHGTAESLRDAEPAAVAVLLLRNADAAVLNLMRPLLKKKQLRLIVWAPEGRLGGLAKRAPDFFDWIHHVVACPPDGVAQSSILSFRAAVEADQPLRTLLDFATVRRIVRAAYPGRDLVELPVDPVRAFFETVDSVRAHDGEFLFLPGASPDPLAWALAVARRGGGVVVRGSFSSLELSRPGLSSYDRRRDSAELTRMALADFDEAMWSRPVIESTGAITGDRLRAVAASDDPAAACLELGLADPAPWRGGRLIAEEERRAFLRGELAADPAGRRWGELVLLERDGLLAEPPHPDIPDAVRLTALLWSDTRPRWSELAESAASLGFAHVALEWARSDSGRDLSVRRLAEAALVQDGPETARATLEALREEHAEAVWWKSLALRERLDAGDVNAAADLAADRQLGGLHAAYFLVVKGRWSAARETLSSIEECRTEYERTALGLIAWSLDAQAAWTRLSSGLPESIRWDWEPVFSGSAPRDPQPLSSGVLRWAAPSVIATPLAASAAGRHERAARYPHRIWIAEHWLEGLTSLVRGQAFARLGQPHRAIDHLRLSAAITRRTTGNEDHPWALIADVERLFLEVVHADGDRAALDTVVDALEQAVWPEHRDVKAARALQTRAKPAI